MIPGLTITSSLIVPQGHVAWMRGPNVIRISSEKRDRFWRQFGFMILPPEGCTGIVVNHVDYEIMQQDLAEMAAPPEQPRQDGEPEVGA